MSTSDMLLLIIFLFFKCERLTVYLCFWVKRCVSVPMSLWYVIILVTRFGFCCWQPVDGRVMGYNSNVSVSPWRQHTPRPGWAASQQRCVISTDKLRTVRAVPSPVLFPSLDNAWERPLARLFLLVHTDENTCSLKLLGLKSKREWSFRGEICPSSRWLWRCSPSSSALLRVRLWLYIQAPPLANGNGVTVDPCLVFLLSFSPLSFLRHCCLFIPHTEPQSPWSHSAFGCLLVSPEPRCLF